MAQLRPTPGCVPCGGAPFGSPGKEIALGRCAAEGRLRLVTKGRRLFAAADEKPSRGHGVLDGCAGVEA